MRTTAIILNLFYLLTLGLSFSYSQVSIQGDSGDSKKQSFSEQTTSYVAYSSNSGITVFSQGIKTPYPFQPFIGSTDFNNAHLERIFEAYQKLHCSRENHLGISEKRINLLYPFHFFT